MIGINPNELIFGALAGMILAGALLASLLFRTIALAAAASAVVFIYVQGVYPQDGIASLLQLGVMLRRDAAAYPDFIYGMALGTLSSMIVLLIFWGKRAV